VVVIDRELS